MSAVACSSVPSSSGSTKYFPLAGQGPTAQNHGALHLPDGRESLGVYFSWRQQRSCLDTAHFAANGWRKIANPILCYHTAHMMLSTCRSVGLLHVQCLSSRHSRAFLVRTPAHAMCIDPRAWDSLAHAAPSILPNTPSFRRTKLRNTCSMC